MRAAGPSYAEALGARFEALDLPAVVRAPLEEAFDELAAEWDAAPADGPAPFASGVGPDGAPVELSLRLDPSGWTQARFIAQPADPAGPPEERRAFEIARALFHARRWAGPAAASAVAAALEIYPRVDDGSFTGNFRLWLGLAAAPTGEIVAKLYLNPWACAPDHQGALALHHLLASAGQGDEGLRALAPWLRPEVGARPHIVGWDLGPEGVRSVKLYAQARLGEATLRETCARVEAPEAWAPWEAARGRRRLQGEVHVAVLCRPGARPRTRLNLLARDWFRDDDACLAAARAAFPAWPPGVLARVAAALPEGAGRHINFVALDPGAATFYLKVA